MENQSLVTVKPQELTRLASDVAGVCKEIVLKTALEIQGRKYVKVEGWQSIATAHGCVSGSRDVEQVLAKDGTLLGYKCVGEVRNAQTGILIASAEGFVGCDETTWFGGRKEVWENRVKTEKILPKRPDYAIRAMCQTRAISRVCRAVFAHVVVLMDAGLSTTPAEEVPDGGFVDATPKAPLKSAKPGPAQMEKGKNPHPKPEAAHEVDSEDGEWRNFPVGFGKNKGTPLGDLTEDSLKWYCENIKVQTTYEKDGEMKKCSKENIAAQKAFRDALDQAMEEYGWTVIDK